MARMLLVLVVLALPLGAAAQAELADVPRVMLEMRSVDEGSHPIVWVWLADGWRSICAVPCEDDVPVGPWQFGISARPTHWPTPIAGVFEVAEPSALVVDFATHELERILGVVFGIVSLAGIGFGLFGVINPVTGDVVDPLRLIGGSVSLALSVGGAVASLWMIGLSDHARATLGPR